MMLEEFYRKLYTSRNISLDTTYLSDINVPQVSIADKLILDSPITLQEIEIAVKGMKTGKCPGLDGLPIEFYVTFWEDIKFILHSVYLRWIEDDELHESAKEGVISLLEKPGKDQLLINNWRPLTLLCCDYKFFAKILSNRLSLVIQYLIHEDQTGFIKNRSIALNLMNINSVLVKAEENQVPGALMSFDYYKAYDSVEKVAIFSILRKFNFGEFFIRLIALCLKAPQSTVMNNGRFGQFFKVERGLRQGDPLSCFVFILIVEIIAVKIRNNQDIEGIDIGSQNKKLGQYADDLWVSIKHKEKCYRALFKELGKFSDYTGLKINYNKTEVLRIGPLKHTDAEYYSELPIKWSDGPVQILGIKVTSCIDKMSEINYLDVLQKVCKICDVWSKRSLTLLGKITVVNTLILPLFVYRLQVLDSPSSEIIKKLKAVIMLFLWDGKNAKIAYNRLISSFENGGLRLQDVKIKDTALKCKWAEQLRLDGNNILGELYYSWLKMIPQHVFECNLSPKDTTKLKCKNVFKSILNAWCIYNFYQPTSRNQVLDQVIWYNSHIRINGKIIFWKKLYVKDIVYFKDLLSNNEMLSFEELQIKTNGALNFLEYICLKKAIPKEWFMIVKKNIEAEIELSGVQKLQNVVKCTKLVYTDLRDRIKIQSSAMIKWEQAVDHEFTPLEWEQLYIKVNRLTLSTKLRYFQFRLINRYIFTNKSVAVWNKDQTELCTFCHQLPETVMHLFFDCKMVQSFWLALKKWLYHFCFLTLEIDKYVIIFNAYKDSFPDLVNSLILIGKYHIYIQKWLNEKPRFTKFISEVVKYKNVELATASRIQKTKKIEYKWSLFDML